MKGLTSFVLAGLVIILTAFVPQNLQPSEGSTAVLIDDFEYYKAGGLPTRWKYIDSRQKLLPVNQSIMAKDEYFIVLEERGNKFVRAVTQGRAHRLVLPNGSRYDWNLKQNQKLSWEWRANRLPKGAREDRKNTNDTGGAVYVTFSRDWMGRPNSIKYSYSTTLPVGTVVDYGKLKVIVASSGAKGTGKWEHVTRDVVADYKRLFKSDPPATPVSIMIWSDSDTVKDAAEVDFDNIRLQ